MALVGKDHHHLSHVLRMRKGQRIILMDGQGGVGSATIKDILREQTLIEVNNLSLMPRKNPRIFLYQALIKWRNMDLVVRYSVELDICAVIPFSSRRSKPLNAVSMDRVERWRKISLESSSLSGLPYLPAVEEPLDWKGMLDSVVGMDVNICADERGEMRTSEVLGDRTAVRVGLIVGPEGGFTDEERRGLSEAGIFSVTLGESILRAEIAAIVLASAVKCHYGLL
jgi:16S rRNA (uracil1498-N3)-methyltransferase